MTVSSQLRRAWRSGRHVGCADSRRCIPHSSSPQLAFPPYSEREKWGERGGGTRDWQREQGRGLLALLRLAAN
jgi:hypothetical protein